MACFFYGCETWLHTLKVRRLRVFENRALRRIFGPKKDEVKEEWRKPHNKEFNDLYSSPKNYSYVQIKKNDVGGAIACKGTRRGAYRVLVGKPDGKRQLGRPRHRWENNIKMELQEVGWGGMDWIDLAQDRDKWRALANALMSFQVL